MNRNHIPLWNIQFNQLLQQYDNDSFEMGSREHGDNSQRGEFAENEENEDEHNHYSNRVHSLHRNKAFKSHDDLISGYEARVGGLGVRTLGRNRNADCFQNLIEQHANMIVSKMEQDPPLIEDSPASNDLRREALRDMPQCLTLKRCVKQKLQKSVHQKAQRKPISCWKMMIYRISFFFSKLNYEMKNLLNFFELWYSALKKIEGHFGSGVGSFFKFLRTIFLLNFVVAIVSIVFLIIPQVFYVNQRNGTSESASFYWQDIFTGGGFFTYTPLYYGFYTNRTLTFSFVSYNMPHAYFFTMMAFFLVFLIFFGISAAAAYRQSFIETEGGLKNVFAQKIFCGWDYSVATKEAADLKSQAIYNELKALLFESMKIKTEQSFLETLCIRTKQLSMNVLIMCVLIGVGYLMWFFLDRAFKDSLSPVLSAVFVNVIMVIMPIGLSWIVQFENYSSPRTSLYLTLIRTFCMGLIIIGVLFTFWLQNPDQECWGTTLGQEIYRLILFDFILSVIFSPVLDFLTHYFCRCVDETRYLNFDISRNTMHIIYNQILLWVGLIFTPLLPVIVTIKLFLIWYVRQIILLKCCKPSTKTWRARQTITWFLMITFVGLLLVIGLLGYIISTIHTTNCGPFKHYDYIYELVTVDLLQLKKNSQLFKYILLVTKPGFIALVLLGLCALIYYLRAKANAQRKLVSAYRNMLVWEARDKEFLIKNIANITKGKWQYRLQDGRKLDPMLLPSFLMRNKTEEVNSPRSSLYAEIVSRPSTSAVNRRSADLDIEITNDLYTSVKKNS